MLCSVSGCHWDPATRSFADLGHPPQELASSILQLKTARDFSLETAALINESLNQTKLAGADKLETLPSVRGR
jgi:hypothetical protein